MKNRGRIFLLDDDELIISMLARALRKVGYQTQVHTSGEKIIGKIASWHPDLVMLDINLGEERDGLDILAEIKEEDINTQVVMLTANDTAESAIKAMKLGAADYLTKPFNIEEVKLVIENILEKEKLKDEIKYLRKAGKSCFDMDMVGESPVMKEIMQAAGKLAAAKASTILITGASGTGKEVLARYIHNWMYLDEADSGYAPFITVNCTALPDNLIENELFGHTKWSFTDAKTDKKGMFELADGGTILLDEIGDMRYGLQSKFLRVIEERKVRRLGGTVDLPLDLTVVATTNIDLKEAVRNKEFRKDLFFRLNLFNLHLPLLSERGKDIPILARHFLMHFAHKYLKKNFKGFSSAAEKLLCAYDWPGNVRELRNIIERCVVLENVETIEPEHLRLEVGGTSFTEPSDSTRIILPEEGLSLDEVEKDLIKQALALAKNNQTKAAKLLDISYDALRYQAKKFGLK